MFQWDRAEVVCSRGQTNNSSLYWLSHFPCPFLFSHFSSFILNKMSQGLFSGKLKWREYDGSLIAIYEEELSFGTKEA